MNNWPLTGCICSPLKSNTYGFLQCPCMLQGNNEMVRENLERLVGTDDSSFSGIDLATLIRNKYGRSYDVQLIKKVYFYLFVW